MEFLTCWNSNGTRRFSLGILEQQNLHYWTSSPFPPELTLDNLNHIWNTTSHCTNSLTLLIKVNVYLNWRSVNAFKNLCINLHSRKTRGKKKINQTAFGKSGSYIEFWREITPLRDLHFCFFLVKKIFEGIVIINHSNYMNWRLFICLIYILFLWFYIACNKDLIWCVS